MEGQPIPGLWEVPLRQAFPTESHHLSASGSFYKFPLGINKAPTLDAVLKILAGLLKGHTLGLQI